MSRCEFHNVEKRTEPLTRFDGTQIGSLTLDVCDQCDEETDGHFAAFIARVVSGDLDDEARGVRGE